MMKTTIKLIATLILGLFIGSATIQAYAKAHVPVKKVQVCLNGKVIAVGARALAPLTEHTSACQLPACDFNNVFLQGDTCSNEATDGRCDLQEMRSDAGGITPACPPGTY